MQHQAAHGRRARGFTWVEMIAVLTILAIVAAVGLPMFASAAAHQRTLAAAQRIAADLRLARGDAIRTSAARTVQFDAGKLNYELVGMAGLDLRSSVYLVDLAAAPYGLATLSANFGGDASLVFDGYGVPDSAGGVTVSSGGSSCTVTVDADTGEVHVSALQ